MALAVEAQLDFAAGEFRGVARHLIPPNGVYGARNVLSDEDGSPYKRGGSEYLSTAAFNAAGLRWLWDGYLGPGRRTVLADSGDYGVLDAAEAPLNIGGAGLNGPSKPAVLADVMFIPGGTLYAGSRKTAGYSTGTITVTNGSKTVTGSGTTWNTLTDAGMLLRVSAAGRYYVVESIDSVTQLTLKDAYQGTTGGGKAYVLSPLGTAAAGGYQSASIYAAAGGRMVACIGDIVYMSAWGNPHSWTATDRHELPGGVECLGAVGLRDSALIFTTGGLFVISNLQFELTSDFGDPQQRVDHVHADLALWGQAGLAATGEVIVVPAIDGAWLLAPGQPPALLSRSITALWREHVKDGNRPGGAVTYLNHYLLPILDTGNNVVDCLVCRLDRPIETDIGIVYPWAHFDGHGANVTAFAVRTPTSGRPKLLAASRVAASRVLDVSGYFEPTEDNRAEADGSVHELDVITRDYPTGTLNENLVRYLRGRYELYAAAGEDPMIQAYVSDGKLQGDVSLWGTMVWGTDTWGSSVDAEWQQLAESAPEDDGRHPFTWRVHKRARYIRFRLRSSDPAAKLLLRSLELFIRPSAKAR